MFWPVPEDLEEMSKTLEEAESASKMMTLQVGEFIMSRKAVETWGKQILRDMNRGIPLGPNRTHPFNFPGGIVRHFGGWE